MARKDELGRGGGEDVVALLDRAAGPSVRGGDGGVDRLLGGGGIRHCELADDVVGVGRVDVVAGIAAFDPFAANKVAVQCHGCSLSSAGAVRAGLDPGRELTRDTAWRKAVAARRPVPFGK
jgi:hypothetical protein